MVNRKGSEGSGIVWCHDDGDDCVTPKVTDTAGGEPVYFAKEAAHSAHRDPALDDLADRMNALVSTARAQATGRRDDVPGLTLGFLVTGAGFLPVWKREVQDDERLHDLVDVATLTDLDALTFDQLRSHLQIESADEYNGTWYAYEKVGGKYKCGNDGMGCYVTAASRHGLTRSMPSNYFAITQGNSPVYDAALNALSNELNGLVTEVQRREREQRSLPDDEEIGLVLVDAGLLPVWKTVTHAAGRAAQAG